MNVVDKTIDCLRSLVKVALLSRPCKGVGKASGKGRIVILANGPSLSQTIEKHCAFIASVPTMAVNFAAIAPVFFKIKPRYYVLADPYLFSDTENTQLKQLRDTLREVSWKMTLLVPVKYRRKAAGLYGVKDIATFNALGVEGFDAVNRMIFRAGLGMPRPRNVLIPSIMMAMALGYDEIYVCGADHSWMQTISVTEENEVVTIQPHFYNDSKEEQQRVRHDYRNTRLHEVVESFAVAFRSYHSIADYARYRGVKIYNSTPGSFIDAFERRSLPEK